MLVLADPRGFTRRGPAFYSLFTSTRSGFPCTRTSPGASYLTDADLSHIGDELWKVHNLLGHAVEQLAAERPEDESPSEASQCVSRAFLRVHELGFGLGFPSDRVAA